MVMRSQNSNSKWVSQKFTQENGENDWNQYQVVLNGGARKLRIRDSDNTSTNLTTTWPVLEAGQKVILTTDYSTFANETIGSTSSVGSTTPSINLGSYSESQIDAFITYSTGTYSRGPAYGGMADIHPEGTRAWFSGYGGVITEYVFSTPWDASTATATGNTFTSPEAMTSWLQAMPAFNWADDGRLFIVTGFPGMTTQAHHFTTYRASTPYDLGSLDTTGYSSFYKYTDGHLAKSPMVADTISFFKMSRDGTKMALQGHNDANRPLAGSSGVGYYPITLTLSSPFNLSTVDRYNAANTTYLANGFNTTTTDTGYNMTHNGRFVTKLHSGLHYDGSYIGMYFTVYPLTTPYDMSTMSTTSSGTILFPRVYPGTSSQAQNTQYNSCIHGVSPCGRYLVYTCINTTGPFVDGTMQNRLGIVDLNGVGWDLGDGKNVDITNHGLSSAPVAAWTQAPKIYVSAETSSARCAVDPVSLAYWKDSSSTTTLVIGHEESGVLAAGDTLLLDDTNTVTISSVVESAGAYTPIIPATTGTAVTGKLHYTGRSFATGTSSQETNLVGTAPVYGMSHGAMCFSPDGVNLYVTSSRSLSLPSDFVPNASYNNMLVRYKLSTPWNIDTAEWVQTWDRGLRHTESVATYFGAHYQIRGVAFNPQGTKLLIYAQYNSGSSSSGNKWLGEWNLAIPWDLNSAQYVDLQVITVASSNYIQTGQMSINSTGTQVAINNVRATSNGTNQRMVIDLTTPYSVSGGVSVPAAWSTNGSEQGGYGNFVTKNGKYVIQSSDFAYSTPSIQYGRLVTVHTLGTTDDLSLNSFTTGTRNQVDRAGTQYTLINNTSDWAGVYGTSALDLPLGFAASEDGTKLYVYTQDGTIRQFDVRLNNNMYKYTVTIPTQASVPDTVVMPSRATEVSYTSIALDDNDSDVLVLSTAEIAADSSTRAIQFKIEENAQESLVNSVKVNLWRA